MYPGFFRQKLTIWIQVGIGPTGEVIYSDPYVVNGRFEKQFVVVQDVWGVAGTLRNILWLDTGTMREIHYDVDTKHDVQIMNPSTGEPIINANNVYMRPGVHTGSGSSNDEANTLEAVPNMEGYFTIWRLTL